jgi:hypothetical protein
MKKISELTRDTQIVCESNEQRTAIFKLCEQAGFFFYMSDFTEPFKKSPNVIITPEERHYHENGQHIEGFEVLPASDFLPLSHFTDNPNDPQTHSANC